MSDFASSLTWYSIGVVDGDRKVSMDYGPARNIHARRDAMSGFLFVLTWVGDCKTYFEGCYGAVCRNPCTEKCDVGVLFVFTWVVDRKKILRHHALQSSCFESKGGDVDLLPDKSTC